LCLASSRGWQSQRSEPRSHQHDQHSLWSVIASALPARRGLGSQIVDLAAHLETGQGPTAANNRRALCSHARDSCEGTGCRSDCANRSEAELEGPVVRSLCLVHNARAHGCWQRCLDYYTQRRNHVDVIDRQSGLRLAAGAHVQNIDQRVAERFSSLFDGQHCM
jgi:hypothetical protein